MNSLFVLFSTMLAARETRKFDPTPDGLASNWVSAARQIDSEVLMTKPSFPRLALALAAGLLTTGAGMARAGSTPVNPPHVGEKSVTEILQAAYGPGVSATRVDDSADQVWTGQVLSSRALARFSANTQSVSFDRGSGPEKQFDVTGNGLAVGGSAGSFDAASFSIVRSGPNGPFSSIASKNADGADHMITYLIDDADKSTKTYALFFEDTRSPRGDFDFNDLALEVKTAAIPLPAAAWMGLAGLGTLGVMKRMRRGLV
jgi:hypothetical protein